MKIIIAGAGAVGTHLAKLLSDEKQDIILMDENEEKLSNAFSCFLFGMCDSLFCLNANGPQRNDRNLFLWWYVYGAV